MSIKTSVIFLILYTKIIVKQNNQFDYFVIFALSIISLLEIIDYFPSLPNIMCFVDCGIEASGIIINATQYRIIQNCECHIHCSSLISIYYYEQEKVIMLFSYHNAMEKELKLEE